MGRDELRRMVRFVVHFCHVVGVASGIYRVDDDGLRLALLGQPLPRVWPLSTQSNHNMEQAAALIGIVGNVEAALHFWGNRDLQILHAEVSRRSANLYFRCGGARPGLEYACRLVA